MSEVQRSHAKVEAVAGLMIKPIYLLYLPTLFLLILIAIVSHQMGLPVSHFTRDPLAITGGHPLMGFLSNLGVIFWSATTAFCLFTFALLQKTKTYQLISKYVLLAGGMTLLLLLDDLFMLHEKFYPSLLPINEKIIFLAYGVMFLGYVWGIRKILLRSEYIYLLLTMLFFALSIIVDISLPSSKFYYWHHLLEDGTKFVGIVSWFGYQFSLCHQLVSESLAPS